jgi:uncharacterized lipoprotein YmbA
MTYRFSAAACIVFAAALTSAGCTTNLPTHYYEISSIPPRLEATHPSVELFVAEVRVPETVSRSEMVVQRTTHESDVLDGQRWLSPLDEQIRRAVVSDLQADLPDMWVTQSHSARTIPKRYTLRIEIQQLALVKGGSARIIAAWTIEDDADQTVRHERGAFEAQTTDDGFESIAVAASTAVKRLSGQIADSLLRTR